MFYILKTVTCCTCYQMFAPLEVRGVSMGRSVSPQTSGATAAWTVEMAAMSKDALQQQHHQVINKNAGVNAVSVLTQGLRGS